MNISKLEGMSRIKYENFKACYELNFLISCYSRKEIPLPDNGEVEQFHAAMISW